MCNPRSPLQIFYLKCNIYLNPHICIHISITNHSGMCIIRIFFNGKRFWVEPRDIKMVSMQMPFGITTVAGKKNTGTFCLNK